MISLAFLFGKPIDALLRSTKNVFPVEEHQMETIEDVSEGKRDGNLAQSSTIVDIEVCDSTISICDVAEDISECIQHLTASETESAEGKESTVYKEQHFGVCCNKDLERPDGICSSSLGKETSCCESLNLETSISAEKQYAFMEEFKEASPVKMGRVNRISNSVWIKPHLNTDDEDVLLRKTTVSNVKHSVRPHRLGLVMKPCRSQHYNAPHSVTREGSPSPSNYNMNIVPNVLSKLWKARGDNSTIATISVLYAKFLVVMGLAFPMTEVISTHVTSASYLGFYLYLYFGCIIYILSVFTTMMRNKTAKSSSSNAWQRNNKKMPISSSELEDDVFDDLISPETNAIDPSARHGSVYGNTDSQHHGSFYLRIGAVAFGVGSMIYSGLEFTQYFETNLERNCRDVLLAVTPATRMVFTFAQMYFIFLNAKMAVNCKPVIAYFGLMHMVATNLCVWLNVIIEETKHEILQHFSFDGGNTGSLLDAHSSQWFFKSRQKRDEINSAFDSFEDECKRSDMMGNVVQDASQFLFPCAIEYSLICAAILYVMWRKAVSGFDKDDHHSRHHSSISSAIARRSRHQYSVDCAKANKGLFAGLFVLVLTIISLIVFFALINNPNYRKVALMEVGLARLLLFCLAFIATMIGIYQVRELGFDSSHHFGMDAVLLVVAQTGLIAYKIFTFIACCYATGHEEDSILVLLGALAAILQAVTQTLFILDASRRHTYSADQQARKPGREVVTFLLMCNFAMWAVNTLEKSRSDVNPLQQHFYGLWPWIIIMNITMPLTIFYRFHSTVILCEIWKRCYKAKPDFVC